MANKVLIDPETTIEWRDSGGDETITLASLGAGVGRNGEFHDWGAAPRSLRYYLKFFCQFDATPVVGDTVLIFVREAGLTASIVKPTNDDGDGDIALSALDKIRNLKLVTRLSVDEASTSGVMAVETFFRTAARQFAPVVFNNSADILHSTAANNGVDITPVPFEIQ